MIAHGADVAAISQWIDGSPSYVGVDPEAVLWRRCLKVASESGEVYDALGGMLGENPRKGVTATRDDLIGELLDVALAALGAVEHVTGNQGKSLDLLGDKIDFVMRRAGLPPISDLPESPVEWARRTERERIAAWLRAQDESVLADEIESAGRPQPREYAVHLPPSMAGDDAAILAALRDVVEAEGASWPDDMTPYAVETRMLDSALDPGVSVLRASITMGTVR